MIGGRLIVVASLALLTIGVSGLTLGASGASTSAQEPDPTAFVWKAPEHLNGTFAANLRFEWDGENHCTFFHGYAGDIAQGHPLFWSEWRTGGGEEGFAGLWWSKQQVHIDGVVHSDEFTSGYPIIGDAVGAWTGYKSVEGNFSDFLEVTTAGFDLDVWTHRTQPPPAPPDAPAWIELRCEQPIQIASLSAGQEGLSFLQESFESGIGVSRGFDLAFCDGLSYTFDSSSVLLDIHPYPPNGAQFARGQLTLDHPNGSRSWGLAHAGLESPGQDDVAFTGGPGAYTFTLDHWAAYRMDIPGILVGVDPVDHLDEAVEPAAT